METFRFCMYETIILPSINWTTLTKRHTRELQVTSPETLIRVVKQVPPSNNPVEGILVDPTEWTIFDTISWTIVVLLFLLVIVLMVYLTLASPCCNKGMRCECPSSKRSSQQSRNIYTSSTDEPNWHSLEHQQHKSIMRVSIHDDGRDNSPGDTICRCNWNKCPRCCCLVESQCLSECPQQSSRESLRGCPEMCNREFLREYASQNSFTT